MFTTICLTLAAGAAPIAADTDRVAAAIPDSAIAAEAAAPPAPDSALAGFLDAQHARAVVFAPPSPPALPSTIPIFAPDTTRRRAIEYSDWYYRRLTIHRWASYATIPVFVAQYIVGEKLIDDLARDGEGEDDDSKYRGAHGALAGGVAGLFGVNTVTGLWNLWDARKDPNGRTRRTLHAISMLVADAGFVATAVTAEDAAESSSRRDTHRTLALSSMGLATVSTAVMWFWKE